jgi:hypothetical protein
MPDALPLQLSARQVRLLPILALVIMLPATLLASRAREISDRV